VRLSRTEFTALERRVRSLERRAGDLESVMTHDQRRELDLLRKAEFVVNVARSEGQLPNEVSVETETI
jgi:hypothetical protein